MIADPAPIDDSVPAPPANIDWPLLERVPSLLAAGNCSADTCRQLLIQSQQELQQRFRDDEPVEALVRARAAFIDRLLAQLWGAQLNVDLAGRATLAAVGGYGRRELHPCSDVDLMVLTPESLTDADREPIEKLVAFLWDIGLEVGHSVRTVSECAEESIADVGVMTTLLEARALAGSASLLPAMRTALAPDRVWPVRDYFAAKVREQQERHHKANDTAYNLEPDVKTGPGGLRDIQTIAWVARRHFGSESLDELATHGFLTASELRRLKQAQAFLWKVRFGLHTLTGRHEDRLLFDHQIKLAHSFGYEDSSYTLAVEQLMQRYYRTAMDVQLLNELLLQLFREAILTDDTPPKPLTPQFQVRDGSLEAVNEDLFARAPQALLELFVLLQQNPQLRGVRAGTIRAVGRNLWLIDEEFRQNPRNHRLFLEILRAPRGVTHELRRMNNYGVLGRYIPAFGRVVGRMQYDLFHAYTVDAHTLFVVSNARRLAIPEFNRELPLVSPIMQSLARQEIVYLAALFHDLAKGRGGDHSELGGAEVRRFCREHAIERDDARLIEFLVRHHLTMSHVAQKEDLSDTEVIRAFAAQVRDARTLTALYLLTVADIRGTSPKVWNAWKGKLLEDLYRLTLRALGGARVSVEAELEHRKAEARSLLALASQLPDTERALWDTMDTAYFMRHDPAEVAWHARTLWRHLTTTTPVVSARVSPVGEGLQVMVYSPDVPDLFARICGYFDNAGFSVLDAKVHTSRTHYGLDTFQVVHPQIDPDDPGAYRDLISLVETQLTRVLATAGPLPEPRRGRVSRRVKSFPITPRITLRPDERAQRWIVTVSASDRSGLLYGIARVLARHHINLQLAKISTLGERVEDTFLIDGAELQHNRAQLAIESELLDALAPVAA